ncbi:hypothetical protein AACH06_09655 [Ideonella sp. DXS29W]|uniref:DUF4124 domain-containing protein n=1 Tax=Ideonella lacteola TaxID=2984193 RepID=A0ABU9BRF1_9BURK
MQLATCSRWLGASAGIVIALVAAPVGAVETLTGGAASVCREGKVEMIIGGARAASTCTGSTRAAAPVASRTAVSPMRISDTEQRQRDQDRRAILESELQRERQTLAEQTRQGSGVDEAAVNRTRSNLAALQRELGRDDL